MLKCIITILVQVTIGLGCIVVSVCLRLRVVVHFAQCGRHIYKSLNVAGGLQIHWLRQFYRDFLFFFLITDAKV